MQPTFQIANPEDVEVILMLHAQFFSEIGETENSLKSDLQDLKLYSAKINSAVVGYGTLKFSDPVIAYLGWYGVDPKFRQSGIGQAFLDFLERESRAVGKRSIELDCRHRFKAALQLYSKNGFETVQTKTADNGEAIMRLRKVL